MKDFTAIIPLHIFNENVSTLFEKAVESFVKSTNGEGNLIIVAPADVAKQASTPVDVAKQLSTQLAKAANVTYVESNSSDFSSQVNTAVEHVTTKYFTVLEYDDVFTESWFKNVKDYVNFMPDVSCFLPLTEVIMADNPEESIGYVNEAVWALSFSDELGFLDLESLQNYMNFNTTGGVFNTEDFKKVGGLKASIKLSFWYEFLLRMVYQKKQVYVIPKVGYKHLLGRKGSISEMYNESMTTAEADWWIELAKKEYFFKNDRNKTYEDEE